LQPLLSQAHKKWDRAEALSAFTSVEKDVQAREPTLLYSDVLAKTYDELGRRLAGVSSAPDASGSTMAEVEVSDGSGTVTSAGTSTAAGSSASAGTSTPAGTSTSAGTSSSSADASHSAEAQTFAASIASWPALPDSSAALAQLSSLGLKLIVLSNVDKKSFAHTQKALERGFVFDHVFTAEEIGTYKPNVNNHQYVLKQLAAAYPDFKESEVLCVAQSLTHDHVPAQALGLGSVWIARPNAIMGISGDGVPTTEEAKRAFVQFTFDSMKEFGAAFSKARA
jgi:2-haloalkanoic acid dehalogenase type II